MIGFALTQLVKARPPAQELPYGNAESCERVEGKESLTEGALGRAKANAASGPSVPMLRHRRGDG